MSILLWAIVFVVGLAVLVKGSDLFVTAADQVGRRLGMPPFVVGVLLIGFGTSLPELVSSLLAVAAGSTEIVVGNVLGSNITNILLIMGLAGLFGGPFRVTVDLLEFDLPVMIGSAFVLTMMLIDGSFTTGEGVVCIVMLGVYMTVMLRNEPQENQGAPPAPLNSRIWLQLIGTPVLIFAGAKYTVDAVIAISDVLQIGKDVIAMSAVALGTSLPEVVVALTAARRGQPELAVGNIVGSNIFNTLAVMGIPALLGSLVIPAAAISYALPVFLGATLLHVIMTVDQRVTRGEGAFLLVVYGFFLGRLFDWF